jgi:citrate lyase alpha subunit
VTKRMSCLALGLLLCGPAAAQSIMQPGGWEMKVRITAENPMTGESKKANESVSRMCLTKEYLSTDPYLTPKVDKEQMEQKSAKCDISDEKRTANAASWRMQCTMIDGSSVDMTISNTASARKLDSKIRQVIKRGSNSGIVNITLTSSRIGQCTKEMLTL